LPLLFCIALIQLTHELNIPKLRENKPLVVYGWLKLLGRNENNLEN